MIGAAKVALLAQQSAFDPTKLSGLVDRLLASANVYNDSGTTLASDGDGVQQWNGSAGLNLIHTGTNKPIYVAGGPGGLPCVCFDHWRVSGGEVLEVMNFATGFAVDQRNYSIFLVLDNLTASSKQYIVSTAGLDLIIAVNNRFVSVYVGAFEQTTLVPPSSRFALVVTLSESNVVVYLNSSSNSVSLTASGVNTANFAEMSDSGSWFMGRMYEMCAFSRTLNSTEVGQLMTYAGLTYSINTSPTGYVVCMGDSLMQGTGATLNQCWPDLLGLHNYRLYNFGAGGTEISYAISIEADFNSLAGAGNYFLYWHGTNDVMANSDSGATIYSAYQSVMSSARTAGYGHLVGFTLNTQSTGASGTARNAFNTLVRAGLGTDFDILIDVAADANLGINEMTSAPFNGSYWIDGTHYNDAGWSLLAAKVLAAIPALS